MSVRTHAVFFDFGGTLVELSPMVPDQLWKIWVNAGNSIGIRLTEDRVQHAIEEVRHSLEIDMYDYLGRMQEYWRTYDLAVMDALELSELREELHSELQGILDNPGKFVVFPEVRGVLQELLSRGLELGVISNYHDGLARILKYHRLDGFFTTVVFSQEVRAEKPDPRVFQLALQRAECAPDESIHVGDSYENDYLGAIRAGLHGVWLNRHGAPTPGECASVPDLKGLIPLVK